MYGIFFSYLSLFFSVTHIMVSIDDVIGHIEWVKNSRKRVIL